MALPEKIQKGKDIQRIFGTSFDEFKAVKDFNQAVYTKLSHMIPGFDDDWKDSNTLEDAENVINDMKLVKSKIDQIRGDE